MDSLADFRGRPWYGASQRPRHALDVQKKSGRDIMFVPGVPLALEDRDNPQLVRLLITGYALLARPCHHTHLGAQNRPHLARVCAPVAHRSQGGHRVVVCSRSKLAAGFAGARSRGWTTRSLRARAREPLCLGV